MRRTTTIRSRRRLDDLTTAAMDAGVRMTHQRIQIFRELAATEEHPDAETVYRAVRQSLPTVSLDTVYRTLWMLHDLGVVTTLGPGRDRVRFDVNVDRHHHYVCVRCGLVRDFESTELDGLRVPDAAKRFGSVVGAQVEVRGLCGRCRRKQGTTSKKAQRSAKERSRS